MNVYVVLLVCVLVCCLVLFLCFFVCCVIYFVCFCLFLFVVVISKIMMVLSRQKVVQFNGQGLKKIEISMRWDPSIYLDFEMWVSASQELSKDRHADLLWIGLYSKGTLQQFFLFCRNLNNIADRQWTVNLVFARWPIITEDAKLRR